MISIATNILLPAVVTSHKDHANASAFLESIQERDDVAISEFIQLRDEAEYTAARQVLWNRGSGFQPHAPLPVLHRHGG